MASAMMTTPTSPEYQRPSLDRGMISDDYSDEHKSDETPSRLRYYSREMHSGNMGNSEENSMAHIKTEASSPPGGNPYDLSKTPELRAMSTDCDNSNMSGMSDGLNTSGNMMSYHGDELSPEHPSNFPITPIVENGVEKFYCHLCSFVGISRNQFSDHLEGHFEHKCDQCDYTSRTEGRLKQHVLKFHKMDEDNQDDFNKEDGSSPDSQMFNSHNGGPMSPTPSPANRTPGRNKVYRCKQCEFTATVKTEFWNHARVHIKEEKLLQCPKCPFVTEYKHHLEYHLRNHFGSKPFKCTKCNYACVNKSMLNSHMKSHINIYQYRCADCTYATKYCHSLKLHLRKYNHKPASILNLDGTVDHDTSALLTMKRSGPKGKPKDDKSFKHDEEEMASSPPVSTSNVRLPGPPANMLPFWPLPGGIRGPPPLIPMNFGNFFRGFLPPMLRQPHTSHQPDDSLMDSVRALSGAQCKTEPTISTTTSSPSGLMALLSEHQKSAANLTLPLQTPSWPKDLGNFREHFSTSESSQIPSNPFLPIAKESLDKPDDKSNNTTTAIKQEYREAPLDLTKPNIIAENSNENSDQAVRKRSRKGKAYKLDALCLKLQEKMDTPEGEVNEHIPSEEDNSEKLNLSKNFKMDVSMNPNNEQNNNQLSPRVPRDQASRDMQDQVKPNTTSFKDLPLPTGLSERYNCPYCDISFSDCIMYTMHMGYHGYTNPFKCNMCGAETTDKVSFFLHIARAAHA